MTTKREAFHECGRHKRVLKLTDVRACIVKGFLVSPLFAEAFGVHPRKFHIILVEQHSDKVMSTEK